LAAVDVPPVVMASERHLMYANCPKLLEIWTVVSFVKSQSYKVVEENFDTSWAWETDLHFNIFTTCGVLHEA